MYFILFVLFLGYVIAAHFEFVETKGQICTQGVSTEHAECAEHSQPAFIGLLALRLLDAYNGLIQGLAAIAVGFFTFILMRNARTQAEISSKQADVAEKQMQLTGRQTDIIEKQKEIARHDYLYTHRPRIRIRNVVVHPEQNPPLALFAPGHLVSGQFYISNIGSSDAVITAIGAWVEVLHKGRPERVSSLPTERPYEGKNPDTVNVRLEAGGSYPISFQSENVLPDGVYLLSHLPPDDWWKIYVMGFIEYSDGLKTPRRTAFCRVWSPISGRFSAVQDTDYEHEE